MDNTNLLEDVKDNVIAYSLFLLKKTGSDNLPEKFEELPLLTKKNYLLEYPIEQLCRSGELDKIHLIGSSSGFSKTGRVLWPKRPCDEAGYMAAIEQMLIDTASIEKKKTLVVVSLAFGLWIGGMQIATVMRNIALSGRYDFTIATPGLDLKAAAEVLATYHRLYEQILIVTNPSTIPLLTHQLQEMSVPIDNGKVSFPVVGEYFSEAFREQTALQYGHSEEAPFVVWTGYGSADTGDVAVETQATIALRKFFHHNGELSIRTFGTASTPMILAYSHNVKIEIVDGKIVVTKDQFIPLVRYDTGDAGGILAKAEIKEIVPPVLYESLPPLMLYVYGRADNSIIFYGTNVSINDIQECLSSLPVDMGYGGLFSVHEDKSDGVTTFSFIIYTTGCHADEHSFLKYLTDKLCGRSAELRIKYDNLCKVSPCPLLSVRLVPMSEKKDLGKHKYIV